MTYKADHTIFFLLKSNILSLSTFDLGYPSTIATVWFVIVLFFVLILNTLLRQRDRLEY